MSNPIILAIETSTSHSSVCLHVNGQSTLTPLEDSESQAAALVPAIETLLRQHNLWYSDLTHLAATVGPGSFTGIRIGLSVARTIAFCHPTIQLFPITTLQCLAAGYTGDAPLILATQRAGKGEIYLQSFIQQGNHWLATDDIQIIKPEHLTSSDPAAPILGNSKELLPASIQYRCISPERPCASDLIRALNTIPHTQQDGLRPFYIRPPDAKLPTKPYA